MFFILTAYLRLGLISSPRQTRRNLKGEKLIAGNKTIEFDAEGIAELDTADADRLLTIPGYTEVSDA
jgi:hypothetical protein